MLSRRKRLFLYRGRKALWQTWEVTEFNWVENKRLVMRFCTRLAGLCWQAASTASLLTIHWAELTENRNWRTTVCLLPSPEWWKCWPVRIKTKLQLWNAATCLFLSVVITAVTFLLQQWNSYSSPDRSTRKCAHQLCSDSGPYFCWSWQLSRDQQHLQGRSLCWSTAAPAALGNLRSSGCFTWRQIYTIHFTLDISSAAAWAQSIFACT